MSQAAYDNLQKALTAKRAAEMPPLPERLLAQAACIVLNARVLHGDLNSLKVPRDDVEELDKILKDMGVDVSHDEKEKVNERTS